MCQFMIAILRYSESCALYYRPPWSDRLLGVVVSNNIKNIHLGHGLIAELVHVCATHLGYGKPFINEDYNTRWSM